MLFSYMCTSYWQMFTWTCNLEVNSIFLTAFFTHVHADDYLLLICVCVYICWVQMTDPRTPNISPDGRLRHLPDCFLFYFDCV